MRILLVWLLPSIICLLFPSEIRARNHPEDDASKQNDEPPNILILLADNFGLSDLGAYAHPSSPKRSRTPNIDGLAAEGLTFNNWNSAAHLCSASRAALLTGKYPVRTGVYPAVFEPDAVHGLMPNETTLAEHLKEEGYSTSIVGKWHLGQRESFLPINQGFDEWLGLPYHMSGGSLDDHTCYFDTDPETMWLPLFENERIVEQPVRVQDLASRFVAQSRSFIRRNAEAEVRSPFFLYMAFSHVHQLCAPRDLPEQAYCQWAEKSTRHPNSSGTATFGEAVEEMDWISGQILDALREYGVSDNTLVIFTSDNGPWVSEQSCSGLKGPFEGRWLRENVPLNCTACPHGGYLPSNGDKDRPRLCVLPGTNLTLDGVHCGEDTGLGSTWEANLRMPALVRWPGRITPGTETSALVSMLDVVPTIMSIVGAKSEEARTADLDGMDISSVLFGDEESYKSDERVLFFWRDGFSTGPLPQPFGRIDVAAVKVGRIKAWFWTKSAHFNNDTEVFHDPPLLFDTLADPAEGHPLDPQHYTQLISHIKEVTLAHKASVDLTSPGPLALARDPKYLPCVSKETGCRTDSNVAVK